MKNLRQKSRKMPQISQNKIYKNTVSRNTTEKWSWVQSVRQNSKQPKENRQNINVDFKIKNKTKVNQINYEVEDLEEKNRRILKVMKYVDFCNQQLQSRLEKENIILGKMQQKQQGSDNKTDKLSFQSFNFLKTLEREYCDLITQIRNKQIEINQIENTNFYFEYIEQKNLKDILQKEIQDKNSNLKNFHTTDCAKFKIQQLQKQIQNLKKEMEDMNNTMNLNKKEIKLVKKKKRLIEIQQVKDKDQNDVKLNSVLQNLQKKVEKQNKKLQQLQNQDTYIFTNNQENQIAFAYLYAYLELNSLDFDYIFEIKNQLEQQQDQNLFLNQSLQSEKFKNLLDYMKFDNEKMKNIYYNFLKQDDNQIQLKQQDFSEGCFKLDDFISHHVSNVNYLSQLLHEKTLKVQNANIMLVYDPVLNQVEITIKKNNLMTPSKQKNHQKKAKTTNKKRKAEAI